MPRKRDDDCLQDLRWLYDRRNLEEARYPKLTNWVEETIEETFAFYRLPLQHHKHMKSTDEMDKRFLRRRGRMTAARTISWRRVALRLKVPPGRLIPALPT